MLVAVVVVAVAVVVVGVGVELVVEVVIMTEINSVLVYLHFKRRALRPITKTENVDSFHNNNEQRMS